MKDSFITNKFFSYGDPSSGAETINEIFIVLGTEGPFNRMKTVLSLQCDQMARLLVQYLAI